MPSAMLTEMIANSGAPKSGDIHDVRDGGGGTGSTVGGGGWSPVAAVMRAAAEVDAAAPLRCPSALPALASGEMSIEVSRSELQLKPAVSMVRLLPLSYG